MALRFLILVLCIALGTALVGWVSVPCIAIAYGVLARSGRRPGATALLAGAAAWGGYLGVLAFSGAPVATLGARLATSMQLPSWGVIALTLAFPALLAGSASYLGARLGTRYLSPP